jgi:hypothetical protein
LLQLKTAHYTLDTRHNLFRSQLCSRTQKYNSMRLLFQILFIGFSVTLFGQTAGPDQFMCYGGSVQIGQGTLCEGCCARWIASGGAPQSAIANQNSLITTVNAPGIYQLAITEFEILPGMAGSSLFAGTDSKLFIPCYLFDDDGDPTSAITTGAAPYLPYNPSLASLSDVLQQASVNVALDYCGNTTYKSSVPWSSQSDASEGSCDCCASESDAYWAVHTLSAWQFNYLQDADFDAESDPYSGFTPLEYTDSKGNRIIYIREHSKVTTGCQSSLLFRETSRDVKHDIENALSHEVGHQFGFTHGDDGGICNSYFSTIGVMCTNFGLMSAPFGANCDYFIPFHLNLVRCRTSSPHPKHERSPTAQTKHLPKAN